MGSKVELIYDLIRQRELATRVQFSDVLAAHVLLFKRWNMGPAKLERTLTAAVEMPQPALLELLSDQKLTLSQEAYEYRLLRLPHHEGPWLVGRTSASDFVFAHRSVSKEHCELSWGADGSLLVADRGSKNGSFVDGKRVLPDRPMLLWSKQVLRIGSLDVRFLSPADFYDLLGGLVQRAA